ncbi:MAG TPA: ComEC/Rec2 family competence protein [Candidatus Ignatzschineria merdigallinarum]|uniref:ComEC/Rec2 family competence protein n=1 Tax=Candidatus Ignatzschineria merdigallinarum TaxID=2838621 RepID=A0A9D1Q550_9GAMM|nr:ComEC/Rec2 family competence protein [Candidatus Ignatzschineria merdigallinarum]
MITIAFAFLLETLWLINSPFNLTETIAITSIFGLFFTGCIIYCATKQWGFYTTIFSFSLIGILWSVFLYIPALQAYQTISLNLPMTINAVFTIERNHYPSSTTIKIISATSITDTPLTKNITQATFNQSLKQSSVQIFNIDKKIKQDFVEGEIYQAIITLRARYFRNIPGDRQRILQALARKEIGYGKFNNIPVKIASESIIHRTRQKIAHDFIQDYSFGHYLSALSVGITKYLATEDWNNLRKTGTIHLVSISGLHLSLTAFYAFIIFRVLGGLIGIRKISPYKIAALLSIIVAWSYAILAGLSLPTMRAAIMFSLAMIALLINRPILSLQGISVALLVILTLNPLSVLQPGFWLSFIAVIILILSAKIFTSPLKVIFLTQLTISMLLIPLTASFFGEISIISPLTNLFTIPWTSIVIMPALLIGTLLLFIYPPFATFFMTLANQGVYVLAKSINLSAQIPYASILTSKLPLISAVVFTFSTLLILYLFPRRRILSKYQVITIFKNLLPFYNLNKIFYSSKNLCILILFATFFTVISVQIANKSTKNPTINLYLLPVGEGLSLLFHSQDIAFLFDTGNRFMRFDAGKQVILPTLRHLGISKLDQIFLSLKNQQHIGGSRTIRTQYPQTPIIAHSDLTWLIESSIPCSDYQYQSQNISITPISTIQSSCAFQVVLFDHIRLHLISDITAMEWQNYLEKLKDDENSKSMTQEIWLYPNQGRRAFSHDYFTNTKASQVILFSTKETAKDHLLNFNKKDHIQYHNSYYGTIHLSITMKNAKPFSELRIKNYADKTHYWWLQP